MKNTKENFLKQKLEWTKYRIKVLDEIEEKLTEMREIAVYARDNVLNDLERKKLNSKVRSLQQEIRELDQASSVFWMERQ